MRFTQDLLILTKRFDEEEFELLADVVRLSVVCRHPADGKMPPITTIRSGRLGAPPAIISNSIHML